MLGPPGPNFTQRTGPSGDQPAGAQSGFEPGPSSRHRTQQQVDTEALQEEHFDEIFGKLDDGMIAGLASELAGSSDFQSCCPEEAEAHLLRLVQQGQSEQDTPQILEEHPGGGGQAVRSGARKRSAEGQEPFQYGRNVEPASSAMPHFPPESEPASTLQWPALQEQLQQQQQQHQHHHQQPSQVQQTMHGWDVAPHAHFEAPSSAEGTGQRLSRLPIRPDGSVVAALEAAADRYTLQQRAGPPAQPQSWPYPAAQPSGAMPDSNELRWSLPQQQSVLPGTYHDSPLGQPPVSLLHGHPLNARQQNAASLHPSGLRSHQTSHRPPAGMPGEMSTQLPSAAAASDPSSLIDQSPGSQPLTHQPDAIEQWIRSRPGTQPPQARKHRPSLLEHRASAQRHELQAALGLQTHHPMQQLPDAAALRPGPSASGPASHLVQGLQGISSLTGRSTGRAAPNSMGPSLSGLFSPHMSPSTGPGSAPEQSGGLSLLNIQQQQSGRLASGQLQQQRSTGPQDPSHPWESRLPPHQQPAGIGGPPLMLEGRWQQQPQQQQQQQSSGMKDTSHMVEGRWQQQQQQPSTSIGAGTSMWQQACSDRSLAGLPRPMAGLEEALMQYTADQRSMATLEGEVVQAGQEPLPMLLQESRRLNSAGATAMPGEPNAFTSYVDACRQYSMSRRTSSKFIDQLLEQRYKCSERL